MGVEAETNPAVTVKLALLCPAGIKYADGAGSATSSPLERLTSAPSCGAAPLRVRLKVTVPPEITLAGFTAIAVNCTGAGESVEGGASITAVVWLVPPYVAVTLTATAVETVPACTLTLEPVCPAAIT